MRRRAHAQEVKTARAIVVGTDFITDVLLISLRAVGHRAMCPHPYRFVVRSSWTGFRGRSKLVQMAAYLSVAT
ncbi:MAG: hypothetical protein ACREBG_23185 [Pyrinomonadaceae bacterium]